MSDDPHGGRPISGRSLRISRAPTPGVVIWVAREFPDPHLSALRWLNQHTDSTFAFFAVRVRVVRIADSPLAPVFDVLERPNDWEKQIHAAAQSGSRSWLTEWRESVWNHIAKRHPGLVNPGRKSSYLHFRVEDLRITLYLAQDSVGIFIPRNQPWTDEKKALDAASVKRLRAEFDDVEDGGWSGLSIATEDEGNWDRMADWLQERRQLYERVIREVASEPSAEA